MSSRVKIINSLYTYSILVDVIGFYNYRGMPYWGGGSVSMCTESIKEQKENVHNINYICMCNNIKCA